MIASRLRKRYIIEDLIVPPNTDTTLSNMQALDNY